MAFELGVMTLDRLRAVVYRERAETCDTCSGGRYVLKRHAPGTGAAVRPDSMSSTLFLIVASDEQQTFSSTHHQHLRLLTALPSISTISYCRSATGRRAAKYKLVVGGLPSLAPKVLSTSASWQKRSSPRHSRLPFATSLCGCKVSKGERICRGQLGLVRPRIHLPNSRVC